MKLYNTICASLLIGWIVPASGGYCNRYGSCQQYGNGNSYQAWFDLVTGVGEKAGQVYVQVVRSQNLQICFSTWGGDFFLSEVQAWASTQLDGYPSVECECTPNVKAFPWNKTNIPANTKWVCLTTTLFSLSARCCDGGGPTPDQLFYLLSHAQVFRSGGNGEQVEYSVWSQGPPLSDAGLVYTYSMFNLTCSAAKS